MMKVCVLLLVISCLLHQVCSQNHRAKPPQRGPPRPPVYPGFVKKWQQLQMAKLRGPPPQNRPRPIPVHHNPQKLKKPFPQTSNLNRLIQSQLAVRPFWKNPQTTYRTPTEKPLFVKPTEKYAFVFPKQVPKPLQQKDYDFHVQTNQIPSGISSTHNNPIKQVGEKGPIHTIPAPNLSAADRPSNIEHSRPQLHPQQYQFEPEQQFRHEYHVTESNEPFKHFRNHPQAQQNVPIYSQNTPPASSFQLQAIRQPEQEVQFNSQNNAAPSQNNPNQFYQVIHNVQQASPDTEEIPHQQFLQQFPNFQLLISEEAQKNQQQQSQEHPQQQQLLISEIPQQVQQQPHYQQQPMFVADQSYVQQFQQMQNQEPSKRINVNPEFHSFNYNEQDYQKQNSKSSLISGYNLDIEPEASEIVHQTMARSPGDSVAQSQFVQNFFESGDDNLASNDVEPESAPSTEVPVEEITERADEDSPDSFYSSLPNKEIADTLASLQAAGRINSNLMHLSNRGSDRHKIFVPEEFNDSEKTKGGVYNLNQDDFQDYEVLENEESNSEIMDTSFGAKIKPKRTK